MNSELFEPILDLYSVLCILNLCSCFYSNYSYSHIRLVSDKDFEL